MNDRQKSLLDLLNGTVIADGYRLTFLADRFAGPVNARIAKEFNLTRPETLILFLLAEQDGLTAQEVVALSGFRKNSISRGVKLLMERDAITRDANPDDGRSTLLYITDIGRNLADSFRPWYQESEAKLLKALTGPEREILQALLTKLVAGTN
jgi:DNA-binding MarR family transcriptional regulator